MIVTRSVCSTPAHLNEALKEAVHVAPTDGGIDVVRVGARLAQGFERARTSTRRIPNRGAAPPAAR